MAFHHLPPPSPQVLLIELDGLDPDKDERAERLVLSAPSIRKAHGLRARNSKVYVHDGLREVSS